MTPEKRLRVSRWLLALLIPFLGGLLAWSAKAYDATNVSVGRFVVDSAHVTQAMQLDSSRTAQSFQGVNGKLDRMLDLLCNDPKNRTARQCTHESQ